MATTLSFDDRDLQSSGKTPWLKLADGKPVRVSFASFAVDKNGDPVSKIDSQRKTPVYLKEGSDGKYVDEQGFDVPKENVKDAFPEVVEERGYFIKGVGYITETPEVKEYMNGKESELRYATVVVQWNVLDEEKPKSTNDYTVSVFGFSSKVLQKVIFNNKKWPMLKYDVNLNKTGNDITPSPESDNLFVWVRENKPELFAKLWESIKKVKPQALPTRAMEVGQIRTKLNGASGSAEESSDKKAKPQVDASKASREIESKLNNLTVEGLPF